MNKPLRITDTFKEAIAHLWAKGKTIAGLLVLVIMVDVTLGRLFFPLDEDAVSSWIFLVLVIQTIVYTWFAVRVHRLILGVANPLQGVASWKIRETRFFGWLMAGTVLLMIAGAILLGIVLGATAIVVEGDLADNVLVIMSTFALVPVAYLLARLAVLLPSVALDQKRNIIWAWALSKGNGWRLMLILFGLPITFVALSEAVSTTLSLDAWFESFMGSLVWNSALGFITAIEVALLSIIFKTLVNLDSALPNDGRVEPA